MHELLSTVEVLQLADCSIDSLRLWQRRGTFPRPSHKCGRRVYWTRSEVEKAIADRTQPIAYHDSKRG